MILNGLLVQRLRMALNNELKRILISLCEMLLALRENIIQAI